VKPFDVQEPAVNATPHTNFRRGVKGLAVALPERNKRTAQDNKVGVTLKTTNSEDRCPPDATRRA
jgi:hypothetical protein